MVPSAPSSASSTSNISSTARTSSVRPPSPIHSPLTPPVSAVNISVWSTIELGTGIVAGSLATLRPLLKRLVRTTREHMTLAPLAPGKQRTSTTKTLSGTIRPAGAPSRGPSGPGRPGDLESMPSIFRPWESIGESGGFTTTCVGGASPGSSGKDEKKGGSRRTSPTSSRRGGGSAPGTVASTPAVGNTTTVTAGGTPPAGSARNSALEAAVADRAAIWPFADDATEPVPLPPPPAPLLAIAAVRGIAKVVDVHVSVEPAPEGMLLEGADGAVPLGLLVPQYHRDFRERERERDGARERERDGAREREADGAGTRRGSRGATASSSTPRCRSGSGCRTWCTCAATRRPQVVLATDDCWPVEAGMIFLDDGEYSRMTLRSIP